VLSISVYFAIIPAFERRVAHAKTIEISLITEIFSTDHPALRLPKIDSYEYLEGTSQELKVPSGVRNWLDENPGNVWQDAPRTDYLYRKDPATGLYRRITLPNLVYDEVIDRGKVTLLFVLGILYVLAVA